MSAVGFAMVAVGAMLVYAGMTGASLPGAIRQVVTGGKDDDSATDAGGTGTATAPVFGGPGTGGGGAWGNGGSDVPAPIIAPGPGTPAPRLGGPQA